MRRWDTRPNRCWREDSRQRSVNAKIRVRTGSVNDGLSYQTVAYASGSSSGPPSSFLPGQLFPSPLPSPDATLYNVSRRCGDPDRSPNAEMNYEQEAKVAIESSPPRMLYPYHDRTWAMLVPPRLNLSPRVARL
jgi:hypothetical protein